MSNIIPERKTRVHKYDGTWWVLYSLPYSGRMAVSFTLWQDAMDEACAIEEDKQWI